MGRLLLAGRAALQWRLLLWWALLLLLPTVIATLPVWQMLGASLDHSVYAAQLAAKLDPLALPDLAGAVKEGRGAAISAGGIAALVLTLLLSPLLAGMTIFTVRAAQRPGMSAILAGGAQEYARMLRMLVWSVVPLGLAGIVAGVAFKLAGSSAEKAILESDAEQASRIALVVSVLVFAVANATLDAGRALLAIERRRKSAVLAWGGGVKLLLRRPLGLLGAYLAITVAGLAVAGLLALARLHVPALGAGGTVAAILVAQLAVLALGWMRCARLSAIMALARDQQEKTRR